MSRNFPTWEQTHWDYDKGYLNAETKQYTVEACRRVKAQGGGIHCFAVGRVLEQALHPAAHTRDARPCRVDARASSNHAILPAGGRKRRCLCSADHGRKSLKVEVTA